MNILSIETLSSRFGVGKTDTLLFDVEQTLCTLNDAFNTKTGVRITNTLDDASLSGDIHQLHVKKMTKSDFDEFVKLSSDHMSGDVLYMVDSEYMDAYGQQLCNLTMPEGYMGVAATDNYVNEKISEAVEGLDSDVSTESRVFVKIAATGGKLDQSKCQTSKITDAFVAEDANIQQSKISGLVDDLENISAKFDVKSAVYLDNTIDDPTLSNVIHDLKVVKMKKDDFDEFVKLSSDHMSGDTLYMVDSDYMDAYGQQLCNLTMPDGYMGVAATDNYVDKKIEETVGGLDSSISITNKVFTKIAITEGKLDEDNSVSQQINDSFIAENANIQESKISGLVDDLASKSGVYIENTIDDPSLSGVVSDLSVIKISKNDFDEFVKLSSEHMKGNMLYMVDSDYMDGYGQQLCNITMVGGYIGQAATDNYVNEKIGEAVGGLDSSVSTTDKVFTKIAISEGKLDQDNSVTQRITDTFVAEDANIQQSKISGLVDDLSDINDTLTKKSAVYLNNTIDDPTLSNVIHDLKVVKMTKSDFDEFVKLSSDHMSGDTLYMVDSDYMDAYGQVLCNLTMPEGYQGVAVTDSFLKEYVDEKIESGLEGLDSEIAISNKVITGIKIVNGKLHSLSSESIGDSFIQEDAQIKQSKIQNLSDDLENISAKFDVKSAVYLDNTIDDPTLSNVIHDLKVVKMKKDDFDEFVALSSDHMSGDTLYMVDSDYMDAYGQQLCNLTMPGGTFKGNAVTDVLLSAISSDLEHKIDSKSTCGVLSAYKDGDAIKYQVQSDTLSAIRITNDLFDELTVEEKTSPSCLYVIQDTFINARGQEIRNVPTASETQLSCAANVEYVNTKIGVVYTALHDLKTVSENINVGSDVGDILSIVLELKNILSAF